MITEDLVPLAVPDPSWSSKSGTNRCVQHDDKDLRGRSGQPHEAPVAGDVSV